MSISTIGKATGEVAARTLSTVVSKTKQYAPEILTGAGVVGVVTAGVFAAKATLRLEELVDQGKNELGWVQQKIELGEATQQDLTKAYFRAVLRIARLYAGPVALAGVSITAIVGSHVILKNRNTALVAAYNSLAAAYTTYRNRVIEEFGEEKDRDILNGLKEEITVDEETGKKKKKTVAVAPASEYIFEFDETNQNWTGDHDRNRWYITAQQNVLNDLLRVQKHVFLNEALDRLGLDRTPAGAFTGWFYDRDKLGGDGFIDFGIDDPYNIHAGAIQNGREGVIRLNMNVDGIIADKI